jgi:hypothetical protein
MCILIFYINYIFYNLLIYNLFSILFSFKQNLSHDGTRPLGALASAWRQGGTPNAAAAHSRRDVLLLLQWQLFLLLMNSSWEQGGSSTATARRQRCCSSHRLEHLAPAAKTSRWSNLHAEQLFFFF